MSHRQRNRLLGVWAATLAALLALIAALPGLRLLPERTYDVLRREGSARPVLDLTCVYGVALLLYVIGLVLIAHRIPRIRLVHVIMAMAMLALLIAGLMALVAAVDLYPELPASAPPLRPTTAASETTPEPGLMAEIATFAPPPRWMRVVAALGIGLILAAGLLGAIWRFYVPQPDFEEPPLAQLAARAQAALDELYAGEDARLVILRCYFEMARVLDQSQGIQRLETATPREFAAQLTALGLPAGAVHTLTQLFEDARYGTSISGDAAAEQAIASLRVIVDACKEDA